MAMATMTQVVITTIMKPCMLKGMSRAMMMAIHRDTLITKMEKAKKMEMKMKNDRLGRVVVGLVRNCISHYNDVSHDTTARSRASERERSPERKRSGLSMIMTASQSWSGVCRDLRTQALGVKHGNDCFAVVEWRVSRPQNASVGG